MSAGTWEQAPASASGADGPGFLSFLDAAATPWRGLPRFPSYDADERRVGDDLVATVAALLVDVDPVEIDRAAALPDELVENLRAAGFFALRNETVFGGRRASDYNTFRVVERASRSSVAVGQLIAVQNGLGAAALLPSLPPGPLREFVGRHVSDGTLSGLGDTEPSGQNNNSRDTTAFPAGDGAAYLLNGEKRFISNGSAAGLLAVTAVVRDEDGGDRLGLVFVDTSSPGVTVSARHEYLGSKGLPNGSVKFDSVRIPAERVIAGAEFAGAGQPPAIGRLLYNTAPALAIVRECLGIARDFVAQRIINGRPLRDYDQVQRFIATTSAEVYALESVVRWCLLSSGDRGFEQLLAKNICTVAAWRVADRTVSVLGGEGLETASSKLRRGTAPLPVERLLRDARGLRVSGNVDFLLDIQAGRMLLAQHSERAEPYREWPDPVDCAGLSPTNREHLAALVADLRRLSHACADLAQRSQDQRTILGGHETHRLIGRLAGTMFAMFAVLSRTGHSKAGEEFTSELADVYCMNARRHLRGLWHDLSASARDFAKISRIVSTESALDLLSES